jgi:hypothetical protein
MIGFAILAFAWIPAGMVLIFGDETLRPALLVLWELWPLAFIPVCGLGACWLWRTSLKRKIKDMEGRHDA